MAVSAEAFGALMVGAASDQQERKETKKEKPKGKVGEQTEAKPTAPIGAPQAAGAKPASSQPPKGNTAAKEDNGDYSDDFDDQFD